MIEIVELIVEQYLKVVGTTIYLAYNRFQCSTRIILGFSRGILFVLDLNNETEKKKPIRIHETQKRMLTFSKLFLQYGAIRSKFLHDSLNILRFSTNSTSI